jgi:hypothetical protein
MRCAPFQKPPNSIANETMTTNAKSHDRRAASPRVYGDDITSQII